MARAPAGSSAALARPQNGRLAAATLAECERIVRERPESAEAYHRLGNLLKAEGRFAEAIPNLRAAARLAPTNSAIQLNLGVAHLELRELSEAIACFQRAVAWEPARAEARNILGHALLAAGRGAEAIAQLQEALCLRPGYPAAHDNLGRALKAQGRAAEALPHHRAALANHPDAKVHSNLLYSLHLLPEISPEEVWREHRLWAERHAPLGGDPPVFLARDRSRSRRLRVGYVSPDFVNHAVAFFFEPVLVCHDASRFEVYCYSSAPVTDGVTNRLRARAAHWRDIARISDEAAAELIRRDGIDILVDLAGHTAHHRLLVLARQPAPVQVTWLGYPGTTGLRAIDYRLTDAMCDPPGRTDSWHSETLVRLPNGFSCYAPCLQAPPVGPLPALTAGVFTFGCFNNFAKVTPEMIAVWGGVLGDVPGSRLLLKSRGLGDPETARRVREAFGKYGVAGERLELDGRDRSVAEHLRLYHRVDLALDTFPYNGATTTCEALWMGVPVVTLAGTVHAARVGASFLTQVGLPEWIAESAAEYRATCRHWAEDLSGLQALRAGMRERMRQSSLCDGPGFTQRLESAYREMWVRRSAAGASEHF